MDNLLTTTAKFFLVPEATLSVIFLVIFVVLFGLGIFWERQCRAELRDLAETGEEKFEALRDKMSPDLFIKKYLRKISAIEGKLEELPNVFVSVGIVATFLGLGVAIQGAAELLQTDKLELAKLTAVLGVIAFKFQTSVWGICCSLIFRRLVVERYFEYRQEVVEDLYDRLYSVERESIRTLLERQNAFLTIHLSWQKTFEEERLARQTAQHEALLAANLKINDTLEFMLDNFERFIDTAANFENRAKDFATAVTSFTATVADFNSTVSNFSDRFNAFKVELTDFLGTEFADIKKINEDFSRLQTEHIEKIHDEHASNIVHTTHRLDELHQKFYLDARRFIGETQDAFDKIIRETAGVVHDEYAREAREISNTLSALNSTLGFIQNTVTNLNQEFTDEQRKFFASWQDNSEKISTTMRELSAAAENDSARIDNTQKILLGIADGIKVAQENLSASVRAFADENAAARNAEIARLDGERKNFLAIFSEIKNISAENLASLTKENAAAYAEALKKFDGASKALAKQSDENFARHENSQLNFLGLFEDIKKSSADNFSSFLKEQAAASDSTQKNLLALKSELEKISAGISENALKISSAQENGVQELLSLQRQILSALNKISEKPSTPTPPDSEKNPPLQSLSKKVESIRHKFR